MGFSRGGIRIRWIGRGLSGLLRGVFLCCGEKRSLCLSEFVFFTGGGIRSGGSDGDLADFYEGLRMINISPCIGV